MDMAEQGSSATQKVSALVSLVVSPVAVFWLIEAFDQLLMPAPGLDIFGIRPRTESGLWGIVLAPWLHGGFAHVAANSVPFLIFAALICLRSAGELLLVSIGGGLLGGLGVWALGRPDSVHIGASGVIFAYFGYLLTIGWIERRFTWILVSVGVGLSYGGLILGVLPGMVGVSWESHLFGLLAGVVVARWRGKRALAARLERS
jgi:membrane associated rhomboid family serine protease